MILEKDSNLYKFLKCALVGQLSQLNRQYQDAKVDLKKLEENQILDKRMVARYTSNDKYRAAMQKRIVKRSLDIETILMVLTSTKHAIAYYNELADDHKIILYKE